MAIDGIGRERAQMVRLPFSGGPKMCAITRRDLIKAQNEHYEKVRSKTAPVKTQRKNWLASSVQVKTNDGNKVKIKAPGKNLCVPSSP
jgi:hypothetical protein